MTRLRLPIQEVLRYGLPAVSRATVRRYYLAWRAQQVPPLPERCDNKVCQFFDSPLMWNGKRFKPVLDHMEGVNADNRPHKLRLLCPLCDAQLSTRGGGNKGKVEMSSGGYAHVVAGKRRYVLPAETGRFVATGGKAKLTHGKVGEK